MAKEILTKTQVMLLEHLGKNDFLRKTFYLTGGTALAAFYLRHRYSEDLDFFSENEFDILQADVLFQELQKQLPITKIDFQQSYNRNLFFLHFKSEIVKIELTYFPFPRIERGLEKYGIQTDSLLDIAVNKVFSIYQRTHARDYVDLYCICIKEGFTIQELVKKAKVKFDWHIDPLQLGTQFAKAGDAKDYPRMIMALPPQKWRDFFFEEARKLKKSIVS